MAEDNEYAREVIDGYLTMFRFATTLTASGEEALEEARKNKFDLLVFDYKMPGIDGVEAFRRIKEETRGQCPRAILISSYGRQELIEKAAREGFDDVLPKPITQSVLYNCIVNIFIEERHKDDRVAKESQYPGGFDKIRGAKILIVEDNEINQQVTKELLEYEGFWVDIVGDGQEAVNKVIAGSYYDLIFMDLQMPVLDGYAAAGKLRQEHSIKTPIIALSADAMEGTSEKTEKAGMNDYVSKPINKHELFEAMVKYIEPKEREINEDKKTPVSEDTYGTFADVLLNFDVKDGLERMGGNAELYSSILRKFAKNHANFIPELKEQMDNKNFEESKKLLHKMKGVSGNIAAKNLNGKIKKLEHKLKSSDPEKQDFADEIADIDIELSRILEQIDKLTEKTYKSKSPDNAPKKMDDEDIIEKFEALFRTLTQYDTHAKQLYSELKEIEINAVDENFDKMGDFIDEYDFDAAGKLCKEIISTMRDRKGGK